MHLLKINYDLFFKKIEQYKIIGENILAEKIEIPKQLKSEIEEWQSKVLDFIKQNIQTIPEDLTDRFKYTSERLSRWDLGQTIIGIDHHKKTLEKKIKSLQTLYNYISIIDSLKTKKPVVVGSVEEKILFTLNKLYSLYNSNDYYSISLIFDLNEINYRDGEPNEIADNLRKRGYGIMGSIYSDSDLIKISVKGAAYIERKNKVSKKQYKEKKKIDINDRIDSVMIQLEKLGYGQEIIFNELEELRGLSEKLSKKSWGQLIKSKVVDLAMSEIINKETASFIYESLVDEKLNLLK